MRTIGIAVLLFVSGCHTPSHVADSEPRNLHLIDSRLASQDPSASLDHHFELTEPITFQKLWHHIEARHPAIQLAAADVNVSQGQLIQASVYPNPKLSYQQDNLGNNQAPDGGMNVQLVQEIVTAGKRQLDISIAATNLQSSEIALLSQRFDLLTRIRKDYYEWIGWNQSVKAAQETVHVLERNATLIKRQVEDAKLRPRADLLRQQAQLEEAKINLRRTQASYEASWKRLAVDIGSPKMPSPVTIPILPAAIPEYQFDQLQERVLAGNQEIKQAERELEASNLEVERAQAEAIPNVSLGAGYSRDAVDHVSGASISLDIPLPLWDRKQGLTQAAKARAMKAQAKVSLVCNRLLTDLADTFARYQSSREQAAKLEKNVIPQLQESADSILKSYQAGAGDFVFADVLMAQDSLNDARQRLAEAQRSLWITISELQGLIQEDVGEEKPTGSTAGKASAEHKD